MHSDSTNDGREAYASPDGWQRSIAKGLAEIPKLTRETLRQRINAAAVNAQEADNLNRIIDGNIEMLGVSPDEYAAAVFAEAEKTDLKNSKYLKQLAAGRITNELGRGRRPDLDALSQEAEYAGAAKRQSLLGALQAILDGASESVAKDLRPDLTQYGGDADVHFVWGTSKHGLLHIGEKRGRDVLAKVIEAVAFGQRVVYVPTKKTARITHGNVTAVLSLDEHGKRKTWLLTGWEEGRADATGEVGTHPEATQVAPTFSRDDLGAVRQLIIARTSQQDSTLAQRAFHGSPHAPFERFSDDHIGTGEGAQAYGWGHYFASLKEVARYYRDKLSDNYRINNDRLQAFFTPGRIVRSWAGHDRVIAFHKAVGPDGYWSVDVESVAQNADGEWAPTPGSYVRNHSTKPTASDLREAGVDPGVGALYRVDLAPTDEELLDWDKPLSEQPKKVRDALVGVSAIFSHKHKSWRTVTGGEFYIGLAQRMKQDWGEISDPKGGGGYSHAQAASRRLLSLGIRGIKYRSQGAGSYNYVIFDPADVTIEEVLAQREARDPYVRKIAEVMGGLRKARSSSEAAEAAKTFLNQPLTNEDSGITATVSGETLGKMLSKSSWWYSVSSQAHIQAVANLDKLFPIAIHRETRPPNKGKKDKHIERMHQLDAAMPFGGEVLRVSMTLKEFVDPKEGTRIYYVNAVEIEKAEAPVNRGSPTSPPKATSPSTTPPGGFQSKFDRLVAAVKRSLGNLRQGPRQLSDQRKRAVRGETQFLADGRAIIRAFRESQDLSTLAHELGHVFRRTLKAPEMAKAERACGVANRGHRTFRDRGDDGDGHIMRSRFASMPATSPGGAGGLHRQGVPRRHRRSIRAAGSA